MTPARDDFERFVQTHEPTVRRLAGRLLGWGGDVDDAVQEVLIAVLRHRSRFRGDADIRTWLTRIAINACRAQQRKRRAWWRLLGRAADNGQVATGFADAGTAAASSPESAMHRDETARTVQAAVAKLAPNAREVIVLRYLEELDVDDIAEILDLSRNAVEVRLTRARRELERILRAMRIE